MRSTQNGLVGTSSESLKNFLQNVVPKMHRISSRGNLGWTYFRFTEIKKKIQSPPKVQIHYFVAQMPIFEPEGPQLGQHGIKCNIT